MPRKRPKASTLISDDAYARALLKKLRLARVVVLDVEQKLAAGGEKNQKNDDDARLKRALGQRANALEKLKSLGIDETDARVTQAEADAVDALQREIVKKRARDAERDAEQRAREDAKMKRGKKGNGNADGVWALHKAVKVGELDGVRAGLERAIADASQVDPRACGAGMWACAKLATRLDESGKESDVDFVKLTARAMQALMRRMVEFESGIVDARGASGTLWAAATCGRTRCGNELDDVATRRAVNDAATRLTSYASKANGQDAANALWGAAKLRKTLDETCATTLANALAESADAKMEEISIALWAFGTFAGDGWKAAVSASVPLVRRAKDMAKNRPKDWSAQAIANAAWACGKLATSDPNHNLSDAKSLVGALLKIAKDTKNLSAQGFAHVLQAAGAVVLDDRLLPDCAKFTYEGLRSRSAQITGADLACVSETTEILRLHTSISHGEKLLAEIKGAIERGLNAFDWQTIGRLDVIVDGIFGTSVASAMHEALRKRGLAACDEVNASRMDTERGSADALLAQSIAAPVAEASSAALVVDDGHRLVTKRLRRIGWSVTNWQRFSRGEHSKGTCWPELPPNGDFFAAAVVRLPPTKASLAMVLHAVAASVRFGAPVWIHGAVTEGLRAVIPDLPTGLFERARLTMRDVEHGVVLCHRSSTQPDKKGKELKKWREKQTLDLSDVVGKTSAVSWISYPGLFAGGGLDVMTDLLLRRVLPTLNKKSKLRVLDYCSGNGVIASAVRLVAKKSKLTLLDADALALEAAKKNLDSDADFVLSDGWTSLPSDKNSSFDLILSNPPVHLGLQVDFLTLRDFLSGAGARLAPDGVAYFVAQRYVPCAALAGDDVQISLDFKDSRFAVWRCTRR